ncbi:disease resistance protein RPM1-like [Quercus robur]|uniref:disease resistance protein RPM1-like n=1 Tax=Quercus robur TaxID=38942 RepID=UPI002161D410|nr:disease resistance protein RPM1-like [Quercus robur]XP_050254178.1 disease resistance protein RPM1-like [Quercus robur]XP_050254179.1 disease resistance protein RPM1-like [Quercus robur]XP_050254180.1 disease resistance protein RPM1-like [Quercus robur]XP_050254181.1 disease resistance protein RPM1-like [Quercus robur]XP_050254182.1 disease resistance protein RPM1-like [Quercus robur]
MDQAVVELLIDNIISILSNEASLLWGARDAIEDIKDELISMRSFVVDADRKGVGSEGEKTWVPNVRDMAFDVEDIIDKFIYHMNHRRIEGRSSRILHHTIYFPRNLWVRHQTATKIQKINGEIKGIRERNQRYDINHIEGTSSKDNREWLVQRAELSLFLKEDKLVGIEKKRQVLMRWLMDGVDQTVISIVGMGGSGKTTLVANTYNNGDVKKHFKCCAWITISQAYVLEDLLRSMVKRFCKSMNEMDPTNLTSKNYRELVEMLVGYLKEKRYLLFLDDVWDTSILNQIKLSILDNCHMGRIILTTRKENVASFNFEVTKHVYRIQPLEEDEAWDLFCKKAFPSSSNRCYSPDLVSFAQELVRRCAGLPLAIAALGSLVYSKNESQWTYIYKSLNWSPDNNPELEVVKTILLLSFNDLPHQLKHCFLYCSLLPEDYEIRRKRLIKLWMAEGFVEQVKGSTPEEVAESYLVELIFRSMLQVVNRNEFGRPKACKMHDVMRDVALPISEKTDFWCHT